jgi:hypothetical protein
MELRALGIVLCWMAQVFRPGALLVAKIALLGVAAAIAAGVVTIYKSLEGPVHVGDAPQQPIPFSHRHHAGDDGIDCRYCHTAVEEGRFAGVPSTEVCLTCHSQLFTDAAALQPLHESARTGKPVSWTRVHDLPGFVYLTTASTSVRAWPARNVMAPWTRCH